MLAILLILPLLVGLACTLVLPPEYAKYPALAGTLASFAMLPLVQSGVYTLHWFSSAGFIFNITTSIATINLLLLVMIFAIAPLVFLYSFGFMDTQSQQRRFYSEMLVFETAMVLFAMSGNFITLFIAWEFLSVTSYLLIGFWNERKKASMAARKAITMVMIGDIAILAAIAVLAVGFKTLEFAAVLAVIPSNPTAAVLAAALLAVAVLTKSAQLPFQEWLTDAMEGPAPVSAFLHSTTMVKAGVFLVIILLPLFAYTGVAAVLALLSLITIAIVTMNALKETHIKKIIAYSTIQELALMVFAVCSGAVIAGIFLFFAQSFYKALLFFSSGAVMKVTDKESIKDVSGLKRNNLLYIATVFGVLSLVGFVPFDGFFAGSAIAGAFSTNLLYYIILSIFGMLTSFYMFRWLLFTSRKEDSTYTAVMYETLPRSMVLSALILGIAALLASFAVPYFTRLTSVVSYSVTSQLQILPFDEIIELAMAVVGITLSYVAYKKNAAIKSSAANAILYNKVFFNYIYNHLAGFVCDMGDGAMAFDQKLNAVFRNLAMMFYESSRFIKKLSYGDINLYVLTFSAATVAALLLVYFMR